MYWNPPLETFNKTITHCIVRIKYHLFITAFYHEEYYVQIILKDLTLFHVNAKVSECRFHVVNRWFQNFNDNVCY